MADRELQYLNFPSKAETQKSRSYGDYNVGTAAYDEIPELYIEKENKRLEEEKRRKKRQRVQRAEARGNNLQLLKLILSAAVLCAGCIVTIIGVSSVTEMRYEIQQLREELSVVQNENIVLSSEISDTINLEYIEDRAINELGMAEPQSYQIKTITVPEQSYTVQYEDNSGDAPTVDAQLVKEFLTGSE